MTPHDRVVSALAFRPPDRVPLFDSYWAEFVEKWRREKGLADDADIAAADETPWPSRREVLREDGRGRVERKAGMDPHAIRERFGRRLAIVGGICNAQVLPRGDPKEIEAHLRDLLSLGREGGLIAGAHSIGPDVPVEAYEHFVRALRRLGNYALQV